MERRGFIKFCAASAAGARRGPALAADARRAALRKARLVDENGAPLRAEAIPANRNLIFHYPFAATPCFLLNLGKPAKRRRSSRPPTGEPYEWRAASAPARSIVAYSAICAHQLAYPTKDISFISFRAEKSARNRIANVIHCCAEHSQYDPAEGARVLAGPAPQPLAAILLEHDRDTRRNPRRRHAGRRDVQRVLRQVRASGCSWRRRRAARARCTGALRGAGARELLPAAGEVLTWLGAGTIPSRRSSGRSKEPNGLLAAGGDLSPQRLLEAYRHGIFPWYSGDEPVLWWSPDPRMVLLLRRAQGVALARARALRNKGYEVRVDTRLRRR